MGVYKRKLKRGIRWYYSGQYLTVKYFSKAIYRTKSEALKAERRERDEIEQILANPGLNVTLFDLMQERLDELKLKRSTKYYRENCRFYKMLYEAVGDVKAFEVSRAQINHLLSSYSQKLQAQGKTNHKVNAMLRCLKALFNYAIKLYGLRVENPCARLSFYAIDKRIKYVPSDREIGQVKELLDDDQCLLFNFVMETGARIGEALRLTYLDIQDDYVILYTRKSKNSNLMPRKVPKPVCIAHIKQQHSQERVFSRWSDQPRFLEKFIKELGHNSWSWHNLRHRRASLWSKEGKPLFEIMSLLGHSNLSTTQNYLQLLP